jgi:hypothetical protein
MTAVTAFAVSDDGMVTALVLAYPFDNSADNPPVTAMTAFSHTFLEERKNKIYSVIDRDRSVLRHRAWSRCHTRTRPGGSCEKCRHCRHHPQKLL